MANPYEPPDAPLKERFPHDLPWPETWRLRALAWIHIGGGVFGLAATAVVLIWTGQLSLLALVLTLPFVACIACGGLMRRDPLRAVNLMRFLLWLQVPHFVIAGIGYEFFMGALALVEINCGGNFLIRPGGGAGFYMTYDDAADWAVGVNFAPLIFLSWLKGVERALFHILDVRAGLAIDDA